MRKSIKTAALAIALALSSTAAPAIAATITGSHSVLDNSATKGAFWLRPFRPHTGMGGSWAITHSGASLDWNGDTATLTGKIVNRRNTHHKFGLNLVFSGLQGFSDGQSPACGSAAGGACRGDELNWAYFSSVEGQLTGRHGLYGVNLDVAMRDDAPNSQLGFGANNYDMAEGMASWLQVTLSEDSHFRHFDRSNITWRLGQGDPLPASMNIGLEVPTSSNVPEIDAGAGAGSLAALGALLAFVRSRRRNRVV